MSFPIFNDKNEIPLENLLAMEDLLRFFVQSDVSAIVFLRANLKKKEKDRLFGTIATNILGGNL